MKIVQVSSTLWYQKARKTYICQRCGRIINRGEYYYRYKSCSQDSYTKWITPIEEIYCKRCGDSEKVRQEHIATIMNPIVAVLSLIGLGIGIFAIIWIIWTLVFPPSVG